jgi:hypothetical protein
VAELVEMYGRYHAHGRPVDEVIELVELTEKRNGARRTSPAASAAGSIWRSRWSAIRI